MIDEKRLKQIERVVDRNWGNEDEDNRHLVTAGRTRDGAFVYPAVLLLDLIKEIRALKRELKSRK